MKSINFGLAYGMSPQKLSRMQNITVDEAKALIDKYFSIFPSIRVSLERSATYGVNHGHIRTMSPFRRVRKFPGWRGATNTPFAELGAIERQSKNTRIQGSAADITKLALVLVRDYLEETKFPARLVSVIHDELVTIVHKDKAQEWKQILTELMEKAGKVVVKSGLLKAEASIMTEWRK